MFRQMEKEKREIRMEKIVNLLNEYEGQESWSYDKKYGIYIGWGDDLDYECFICSKQYGFIKWLVENEKIDQREIEYKFQDALFELEEEEIVKEKSDFLIMLLSIQNEPIRFLCEILK